jgi:hypothetical protein
LGLFNLGGDLEGMEEVDLRRIKTGGSRWNDIVDGSGGTNLGFSGELALLNLALEIKDCLVGEDKADLLLEVWDECFEFRFGGTKVLEQLVVLLLGVEWVSSKLNDLMQQCLYQ